MTAVIAVILLLCFFSHLSSREMSDIVISAVRKVK